MTRRITEPDIAVVVVTADTSDEALRSDGTPLAIDETHAFTPVDPDVVMLAVPRGEVDSVAFALRTLAGHYRRDTGHDAEGIAVLNASADVLDKLADDLDAAARGGQ